MLTLEVYQQHNRVLRERVEELEETVRQLQQQIAGEPDPLPEGLPHLTRREEATLRAIMRRGTIGRETLFATVYGSEADVDIKIIDVWVCKLRRKLEGTGIRIGTKWGVGFFIEKNEEAEAA